MEDQKWFVKRDADKKSVFHQKLLIGGAVALALVLGVSWIWLQKSSGPSPGKLASVHDKVVKEIPKSGSPEETVSKSEQMPAPTPSEGKAQESPPEERPVVKDDSAAPPSPAPSPQGQMSGATVPSVTGPPEGPSAETPQTPAALPSPPDQTPEKQTPTEESPQPAKTDSAALPSSVEKQSVEEKSPAPPEEKPVSPKMTPAAQPQTSEPAATGLQSGSARQEVPEKAAPEEIQTAKVDTKSSPLPDKEKVPSQPATKPQKPSDQGVVKKTGNHGLYIVRLGSFKIKKNAHELYEAMKKKGYEVEEGTYRHHSMGSLYTVQLKPVKDIPEARSLIAKIKRDENIDAFIVKEPAR